MYYDGDKKRAMLSNKFEDIESVLFSVMQKEIISLMGIVPVATRNFTSTFGAEWKRTCIDSAS